VLKIAPRWHWNDLRPLVRGRAVTFVRRVAAAGLLVVAVVLTIRPTAAGPAPPAPGRAASAPAVPAIGGPGFSTVPIRLADAGVADLLSRGMRVDVVTLDAGDRARNVLATMATVVDVRSPPATGSRILGADDKGPLVLISVPVDLATQVAALSLHNPVAVTLR
jgi:hypothetical protein